MQHGTTMKINKYTDYRLEKNCLKDSRMACEIVTI